jgi:AcrR family transcriptional regulator
MMIKTKDALMQAAGELMREVGYDGMTTAAVAKRAQVSEGTIYRYFPSKEALAEAVFADIWRLFNEYLETHLPPREQPVERLEAFWPLTIKALDALMPKYGNLAQQEHLYFTAKHHNKCFELPPGCREYVALLEEAIRLAQTAGRVRPDVDPSVAALFLFFGAGDLMEFYGDMHNPDPTQQRIPPAVFEQLFMLMRRALYGDLS